MPSTVTARANAAPRCAGPPPHKTTTTLYRHIWPNRWPVKSCEYDPVTVCCRRPTAPGGQHKERSELALCGESVLPMLFSHSDDPSSVDLRRRRYEPPYMSSSKPFRRRVEFNPLVSTRWPSPVGSRPPITPFHARGVPSRSDSSGQSLRRGDSRLISARSSFVSSMSRTPSSRRSLFGCAKSGTDILPPPPQFRSDRSSSFVGLSNGRSSLDTCFSFTPSKSAGLSSSNVSWEKRSPQPKPSAPIMFRPNAPFRATRQCASDVPVTWCRLPSTGPPRVSKENVVVTAAAALKRDEDVAAASRRMLPPAETTRPSPPGTRRTSPDRGGVHKMSPRTQTLSDLRLYKKANLGCSLKPRREALIKYRPSSELGHRKISYLLPAFSGNVRKWDPSAADVGRRTKTTTGPATQFWSTKSRLNLSEFGKSTSPRDKSPRGRPPRRRSPRRQESTDKSRLRSPQRGPGIDAKVASKPVVQLGHSLSTDDRLGIVREWLKRKPVNPIVRSKSDGGLHRGRMPSCGERPGNVERNNSADLSIGSNRFHNEDGARSSSPRRDFRRYFDVLRLLEHQPDFCNVSAIAKDRKLKESDSNETIKAIPKSANRRRADNSMYEQTSSEPYLYRSQVCRARSPHTRSASSRAATCSSEPHIFPIRFPIVARTASPVRCSVASKTHPAEAPRANASGRPLRRAGSPNRNLNMSYKAEQKLAESKSSKSHSQTLHALTGGSSVPITSYDSRTWHSSIYPASESKKVSKCRSIGRTGTPVRTKRELRAITSPNSKRTSVSCDSKPTEKNKPSSISKSKVAKSQGSNKESVKNVSSKRKKLHLNLRILASDVDFPVRRTNHRRFDKADVSKSATSAQHSSTPNPPRRLLLHAGGTDERARVSTPRTPKRSSTRNSSVRPAAEDHAKTHARPAPEDAHKRHKEAPKTAAGKSEEKVLRKEVAKNKRSQKTVQRKTLKVEVPFPFELLQACKESVGSTDTLTRKSDGPKSNFEFNLPDTISLKQSMKDNIPVTITRKSRYIKTKKTTESSKVEVKEQIIAGIQSFKSPKRQRTHVSVEQRSTPDTTTSGFTDFGERPRGGATKSPHRFEKRSLLGTDSSADASTPPPTKDGGCRSADSPRSKAKGAGAAAASRGCRCHEGGGGGGGGGVAADAVVRLVPKGSDDDGSEVKEAFDALPLHNQYALNDLSALLGIARLLNIDADACLTMVGLNASGGGGKK